MSKSNDPGQATFFSDRKSPVKEPELDLAFPKFQGDLDQRVEMFDYDQMGFPGLPDPMALLSYNGYNGPLLNNMMPIKREWNDSVRNGMASPVAQGNMRAEQLVGREWDRAPDPRPAERPRAKSAHNVIEQRYRNKINDKFTALQNLVPTLRVLARKKSKGRSDDEDDDEDDVFLADGTAAEDLEGLEPARKLNKGTILTKSVEYIKFLERKNDRMNAEWRELVERARMLGVVLDERMLNDRMHEPFE